jgi:hypothetical protein
LLSGIIQEPLLVMVYSLNLMVIRYCTSCILLERLDVHLVCRAAPVVVKVPQMITTVFLRLLLPSRSPAKS